MSEEVITTLTMSMDVTQYDLGSLHDVMSEITPDGKWSNEELIEIFSSLSENTRFLAFQWGIGDTQFRDDAYVELLKREETK